MTQLRPAQADILRYTGGKMAVRAVPGSGKTFTLTSLATRLIAQQAIDPYKDEQILIVTYTNSSVNNFKSRMVNKLLMAGYEPLGFDVRTLHSVALEIVRFAYRDSQNSPLILDDMQSRQFLTRAVQQWRDANLQLWVDMAPSSEPNALVSWRKSVEDTAYQFIQYAKNQRLQPEAILVKSTDSDDPLIPYVQMFGEMYKLYQIALNGSNAIDYNDQVWMAVELLETQSWILSSFRNRWKYVMEDEAQDSIPLQAILLNLLVGDNGNLIRVGDPNQAITSTFTAAHPRYFNQFADDATVTLKNLPNSGRNGDKIYQLANQLVDWVTAHHPVQEVKKYTFYPQHILPTPENDPQPNPTENVSVLFREFEHRDTHEYGTVITWANGYRKKYAHRQPTVAILVPTNRIGEEIADLLDKHDIPYDSLLKTDGRQRQVANTMYTVLKILADPFATSGLHDLYINLKELGHPAILPVSNEKSFEAVLKGIRNKMEDIVYPRSDADFRAALPQNRTDTNDEQVIINLGHLLQRLYEFRELPIDGLMLSLGDELFAHSDDLRREHEMAIAYQLANVLRDWQDLSPDKRLPELAADLQAVAQGQIKLPSTRSVDTGFEPTPERLTLATQHSSKGLEWDAVFLVGMDEYHIPNDLDSSFYGTFDLIDGDFSAEICTFLSELMSKDWLVDGVYPGRTATQSAHIDLISERLRLLYVGITRARNALAITWSRTKGASKQPSNSSDVVEIMQQYVEGKQLEEER